MVDVVFHKLLLTLQHSRLLVWQVKDGGVADTCARSARGSQYITHEASVRGSVVLISELPHGRAVPLGALYDLREDAMRKLTIGSVRFEPGLRSVTWSPGRVAPPLLMGVSSSGELVSCVIDPVRGVGSGADWTAVVWSRDTGETSVCNVMQLGTACEEDDERAIVFLLRLNRENRVEFVLARLEVPTWARVPSLTPLLTHVMDATGVVCSLEWFGTCDGESAERGVVGQLAVWRGDHCDRRRKEPCHDDDDASGST